ncbi:MAG: hypothetical protein DRP64_05190 [Verrucomicrobia bacterium]|nr:MAG: hypothetical protein DRP64_05190 [Verrucomicrobiota bacterium]
MKKQIPAIILAITSTILAFSLYSTKQENSRLRKELALPEAISATPERAKSANKSVAETPSGITNQAMAEFVETEAPEAGEDKETSQRRMMRNMVKMMEDNPTMNKIVEASQRGVMGALYSDFIEYLDLNPEETQYFMDLLMYRQMANVNMGMKLMSGELTEEEKSALMEEVKLAGETTKKEMEQFMNDSEDFDEWTFYEETVGERMMLSQMDQMLGDAALSDDTYREVLEIMLDERENFDWSTDLADDEKMDMSPKRFSAENIQQHIADMKAMGEQMDGRMQEILTPEQLAAWRQSGAAMMEMQTAQMQQAQQMLGGE